MQARRQLQAYLPDHVKDIAFNIIGKHAERIFLTQSKEDVAANRTVIRRIKKLTSVYPKREEDLTTILSIWRHPGLFRDFGFEVLNLRLCRRRDDLYNLYYIFTVGCPLIASLDKFLVPAERARADQILQTCLDLFLARNKRGISKPAVIARRIITRLALLDVTPDEFVVPEVAIERAREVDNVIAIWAMNGCLEKIGNHVLAYFVPSWKPMPVPVVPTETLPPMPPLEPIDFDFDDAYHPSAYNMVPPSAVPLPPAPTTQTPADTHPTPPTPELLAKFDRIFAEVGRRYVTKVSSKVIRHILENEALLVDVEGQLDAEGDRVGISEQLCTPMAALLIDEAVELVLNQMLDRRGGGAGAGDIA